MPKTMKPIIKWSGAKTAEIKIMKSYFPKTFETYFEPFAGSAAVLFHLNHPSNVISDVHKELITFYKAIKDGHAVEIYDMCNKYGVSEDAYYKVRDKFSPETNVEVAFQFYYLRKTCFRGMMRYNSNGKFNIPYDLHCKTNFKSILTPEIGKTLHNTKILCEDFEKVYREITAEDFVFLDPPYDTPFNDYGYCKFDREHHKRLFKCFEKCDGKQLMVISETDFIADLYKDYIIGRYDKQYRFRIYGGRVDSSNIDKQHFVIGKNIEEKKVEKTLDAFV